MKKIGPHRLYRGDCLKVLRKLEDNSIDSIVTDPPYGLSFMGRKWDTFSGDVNPGRDGGKGNKGIIKGSGRGGKTQDRIKFKSASNMNMLTYMTPIFEECLRVLKPGGYILAFAGTRTQHIMALSIEQAGFEIRDIVAWTYSQGFPKSVNVGKMIDKEAGAVRKKGPIDPSRAGRLVNQHGKYKTEAGWSAGNRSITIDPPATEEAAQWEGWGSALKPAFEPITMARKPFDTTLAKNVLKHGTGALNIDGCRVHSGGPKQATAGRRTVCDGKGFGVGQGGSSYVKGTGAVWSNEGRFPANLIHDGSEEVIAAFPNAPGQQGDLKGHAKERQSKNGCFGKMGPAKDHAARIEDNKSASRFFYTAKASKQDRDEGNTHPTVKPRTLMRYLVRLVTPPKGICLDPFMGSGTTGVACQYEGFHFVGIEREKEYFSICKMRVRKARRLWRESKNQDTPNTTKDKKCQKKRSEKAKASPTSRLSRKSVKSRQ